MYAAIKNRIPEKYLDICLFIQFFALCIGGSTIAIWHIYLKYIEKKELFNNIEAMSYVLLQCMLTQGLFGMSLGIFDWRSRSRKIGLTLHALYLLFCEFIHVVTIWSLYLGFRESNNEWENIFRASGGIIAMILSLFNSFHYTCIHIRIFHCIFNRIDIDRRVFQFPYSLAILICMILTFIPSFWSFTLCPMVALLLGAVTWLPFGPMSIFDLSKIHKKLGSGTFKICCWALLLVEILFFVTQSSKESKKKDFILQAISFYNTFPLLRALFNKSIFRHEIGYDEIENGSMWL